MIVTNQKEIDGLRRIGSIVGQTLQQMMEQAQPGMTTKELDEIGGQILKKHGAESAPKTVYDFPGYTCISVNDVIAHGIPGDTVLQPGDTVNIDVSASLGGFFGDTAATKLLDPVPKKIKKLSQCSQLALAKAMKVAIAGRRINLIGRVVQETAKQAGFLTIKNLCGHGVGRGLHEDPEMIPNYYDRRDKRTLAKGVVIAIEPFIAEREEVVYEEKDGWTLRTPRHTRAIQFEHTIMVTENEPLILTLPE